MSATSRSSSAAPAASPATPHSRRGADLVVYTVEPATTRLVQPLDEALTALFHRPSGSTHLLASPAPELIEALEAGPADLAGLLERLAERFEIADADEAALAARLEELVATGLALRG